MIRAIAKGSILFAFGRLPGGSHLYRYLTREKMGTQATHIDKLARVWPGYAQVWTKKCGLDLNGKTLWMHEGGHTPFPFLISYLLTGEGSVVTNAEAEISEQYLDKAIASALTLELPDSITPTERSDCLRRLVNEVNSTSELIRRLDAELYQHVNPSSLPLADSSVDIGHSGGTLEHYPLPKLEAFISECYRVLKPGGIASHVFDHRDHLYHADKKYPFLYHLSLPDWQYAAMFGHRLLYHNRLLPAQIKELFCKAGFELIGMRRHILPAAVNVDSDEETLGALEGLDRTRLAKRFEGATDADLRTAAGHYLFRKRS